MCDPHDVSLCCKSATLVAREHSKSPRRPNPHSVTDEEGRLVQIVDELSMVGYSEDTDVYTVFERTGQCKTEFVEQVYFISTNVNFKSM